MSLVIPAHTRMSWGFPRVSGDEPLPMPHLLGLAKFSPREWG